MPPPNAETLSSLTTRLNLKALDLTVPSPNDGKPMENPVVTKFRDSAFAYKRPEAWQEEGTFMLKNGLDPKGSRVGNCLMMELRELTKTTGVDISGKQGAEIYLDLQKRLVNFTNAVIPKASEQPDLDMRTLVRDALAITGWEWMRVGKEIEVIPKTIDHKPSADKIDSYRKKWSKLHIEKPITPVQQQLETLAAYFMLSGYGRPGELFNSKSPWLERSAFSQLTNSRENHEYLAELASHMLFVRDPHILEIGQLLFLISDFDISGFTQADHPYHDDYQGVFKFQHPDLIGIKIELRNYLEDYKKDPGGFGELVNRTIKLRIEEFQGHMVSPQSTFEFIENIIHPPKI